jgi:hypothetical protein
VKTSPWGFRRVTRLETNGVRLARSKVPPESLIAPTLREVRSGVVEQLDGLARALGWRYGARFLRERCGRRRVNPCEKRARFANAIPDVVDTQEA